MRGISIAVPSGIVLCVSPTGISNDARRRRIMPTWDRGLHGRSHSPPDDLQLVAVTLLPENQDFLEARYRLCTEFDRLRWALSEYDVK